MTTTSSLISRNVILLRGRTSMRLEPVFWEMLREIADRENCFAVDVINQAGADRLRGGLTSAVRAYCAAYFRDRAHAYEGGVSSALPPLSQQRFNEKMDALDAANPEPLANLSARLSGETRS